VQLVTAAGQGSESLGDGNCVSIERQSPRETAQRKVRWC